MNPFVLWLPGTLLLLLGAFQLATRSIGLIGALALLIVGAVLECAGMLLWVRARHARGRDTR